MPSAPRGRSHLDIAAEDIANLSVALSQSEQLTSKEKITIARRIGFAVGLDLASKEASGENPKIESQVSSLFRKLHLKSPTLRDWDAVVFVKHTAPTRGLNEDSEVKRLEAAFGESVLEGLVSGQAQGSAFVRRSMSLSLLGSKPALERGQD